MTERAVTDRAGAVIVAAGRSARFGQDKLFLSLAGAPVLAWSLRAFEECSDCEEVALVLGEANVRDGTELVAKYGFVKVKHVCLGGERRQDSVLAGLRALARCGWVAIHDAARPLVTPGLIAAGYAAAKATGAATPVVPVKDTVKVVSPEGCVVATPSRDSLRAAQTPQVFRYGLLVEAHERSTGVATDDSALVEALGHPVIVYEGSPDNVKITTPDDLDLAHLLLRRRGGR